MKSLRYHLHVLLFAIFPSVSLYSHNVKETWPNVLIIPILISIIFGLVSYFFFFLVLRHREKTAIMTSIWLVIFFSYGHIYLGLTESGFVKIIPLGPNFILLCLAASILFVLFFFLYKANRVDGLTKILNFIAIFLMVYNLAIILPIEIKRLIALNKLSSHLKNISLPGENTNKKVSPDIYYFIFDRYGNKDVLEKYFLYDNSEFLTHLESKGFYVNPKSFANYPSTFVSLASSLNMTHLDFLPDILGKEYSDQTVVYSTMIENNKVVSFLKKNGYKIYHLGDSWPPTNSNKNADKNYNKFIEFDQFQLFIYENTLLNSLIGVLTKNRVFSGVRHLEKVIENASYRIKKMDEIIPQKGPKFVFGHFLLPHPPYLLSNNCSPLSFEEVRLRTDDQGYIDQTTCANKIMKYLVDRINKKSKNAVIVFQSDEGPYLPFDYFPDEKYPKQNPEESFFIHAGILNAIYLPDKINREVPAEYKKVGLDKTKTPVNTFRLIFNYYFGTDYKLLEDRSFIFKDNNYPYDFFEITKFTN